ncbi:hypothetical protein T265_04492 [Opisthorchis viverrini]|uniref:Uncharacterized protein n=1 Tax=Opisthorchis viverrini TaxID=6198 RepID=A0A075AGG8_OPIVI|nr:hypothetical protein T265_04492 [Opisthorchis viverrini]KER28699.1 hypothetical protein T265_04492 [Opisthorchis viverrini]
MSALRKAADLIDDAPEYELTLIRKLLNRRTIVRIQTLYIRRTGTIISHLAESSSAEFGNILIDAQLNQYKRSFAARQPELTVQQALVFYWLQVSRMEQRLTQFF